MSFLTLAACATDGVSGPPGGFPHALATRACGPSDGPAVAIYLTTLPATSLEPPTPYVRAAVWESSERLTERPWAVAGSEAHGAAWHFSAATEFEVAVSGRVVVTRVHPDSSIEGTVELAFARAGSVSGSFRAPWLSQDPTCG